MNKNRNHNYFSMLIGHEPFEKSVRAIRRELDIPEKGLKGEKQIREWTYQTDKKQDEYYASLEYKKINENIRKKTTDKSMASKQIGLLDRKAPINKLKNACLDLINTYHLPTQFEQALRIYIMQNVIAFLPTYNFLYLYDFSGDKSVVKIEIYAKLTKEEKKDLLKLISMITVDLPIIKSVSDKTVEDISVKNWKNKKHEYDERVTAKEVAADLGLKEKVQRVYDAKRKVANRRKKLFGK